MTRKKKTTPPENETLAPGIDRIAFGKGITKGSRLEIAIPPASTDALKSLGLKPWRSDFESKIAEGIEREAKRVLEDAGLPTDAPNPYNVPADQFHGCVIPLGTNGDKSLQDDQPPVIGPPVS